MANTAIDRYWYWYAALLLSCHVLYARAEPGGGPKAACINGADQVRTWSGIKRVAHLKTGDYVAVGDDEFEPITTFLHRDKTRNARGFRFITSNGTELTLSDEHLVFVAPNMKAVLAKNVEVGHRLYLAKTGCYAEEAVVAIERRELKGRYSPLTPSGVILVNDVLVSCYSQIEDHHLMHRIVNWLLLITSSESLFGTEGLLSNADGMHALGEALWHHFRYWFFADGSNRLDRI